MEITKEAVRELFHGWQTVGVDPIAITPLELVPFKGIVLYCPGTTYPGGGNAVPVWVGGPKVTADDNPGTGGMPIVPGSSITIPIDKPNTLYVVSSQAGQKISWMLA